MKSFTVPTHPLDPLTPSELKQTVQIVKTSFEETKEFDVDLSKLRFETIELYEPTKDVVRAFNKASEDVGDRSARVSAFVIGGGIGVYRMLVNITTSTVVSCEFLPKARPMIQLDEFVAIEDVVKADPGVIEACHKRGITNMDLLCVDPWSSGTFGFDYEEDRHLSYTFLWVRSKELDNLYAHPVDGLNAVVDIKAMKVVHIDDWGGPPIPSIDVNYDHELLDTSKFRTDLKPINVSQPEGVSFTMDGRTLKWHDWSILVGFTGREGITLHNIEYNGRPVCYRASIAEMVVPYGSPRPPHYRKNVFDIGEYGLGKLANSLELGCDCLGSIQYLDGHIIDMNGAVMTIKNAICIHEEDHGVLWKHWDFRTDRTEVRRARRLVVSSISTVGNYEYGSYWYFYLDGMIEFEMKATGIINTVACEPGKPEKYGTEVSPGVVGQIHQHHFCARLDMAVDGDQNTVVECDTVVEPVDEKTNPYGNAYYVQAKPLLKEGGRPRDSEAERFWKFTNPNKTNHVGTPTAYKLEPGDTKRVFCDPNTPSGKRMGWCYNALWVTPYDREERFPTGEYVNGSDGSDGLTKYVQQDRSIDNTDIVAWHIFGLHHPVRPEDFPVQNCVNVGFKLMPAGFFNQNPNIVDMPIEKNKASVHADAATSDDAGGCNECECEEKKE